MKDLLTFFSLLQLQSLIMVKFSFTFDISLVEKAGVKTVDLDLGQYKVFGGQEW